MGPGPINADPRVLRAMSAALVGQYDPVMTGYMAETQELYRQVFRTGNAATLLVDGTSRAGIEATLVSLVRPGERVLVPIFGRFGHLLVEIAQRAGAEVHTLSTEWGTVFAPEQIEEAMRSLARDYGLVTEGAGAAAVAAGIDGAVAIVSGRNVTRETFARVLQRRAGR
jgi:(S)-ureidoglycine-glyoxylate aminotransferase